MPLTGFSLPQTVVDDAGNALKGVAVAVAGPDGYTGTATTDPSTGVLRLGPLPVGDYTVTLGTRSVIVPVLASAADVQLAADRAAAALTKPAGGTAGQALVLDADATTVKWGAAGGPAGAVTGVRPGLFYPSPRRVLTTTALPLNELRAVPYRLEMATSFDRIAVEISTAAAGSAVRLGIYADNGRAYPGALVLDAGSVAADTVGIKALIIAQALNPGVYWIAAVAQTAGCSVRSYVEGDIPAAGLVAFDTIGNAPFSAPSCYTQAGVTAALPATFSATTAPAGSNAAPYVGLRAV